MLLLLFTNHFESQLSINNCYSNFLLLDLFRKARLGETEKKTTMLTSKKFFYDKCSREAMLRFTLIVF
jgi:hypothetical protein